MLGDQKWTMHGIPSLLILDHGSLSSSETRIELIIDKFQVMKLREYSPDLRDKAEKFFKDLKI
jgi:hypothetical protein